MSFNTTDCLCVDRNATLRTQQAREGLRTRAFTRDLTTLTFSRIADKLSGVSGFESVVYHVRGLFGGRLTRPKANVSKHRGKHVD